MSRPGNGFQSSLLDLLAAIHAFTVGSGFDPIEGGIDAPQNVALTDC
jgi:hypothetical protein